MEMFKSMLIGFIAIVIGALLTVFIVFIVSLIFSITFFESFIYVVVIFFISFLMYAVGELVQTF